MTQNYHNPIETAAPANAAIFNGPLGTLDAQITANAAAISTDVANLAALIAGTSSFTQLNRGGYSTTVTLATDAFTVTRSSHKLDTQGGAASDDLATINGSVEGDWLAISPVSAARVIRIVNSGNIRTATGGDFYLDNPNAEVYLYYNGTNWVMSQDQIFLRDSLGNLGYGKGIGIPYGTLRTSGYGAASDRPFLEVTPRMSARNWLATKAAAATYAEIGMAAGASAGAGALTETNQSDSVYVNQAIGAVLGTFGGRRSTTFDLTRRQYYPYFAHRFRIPTDVTNIRWYCGLCAAQVTNVDSLVTSFLGLRYSTAVPDAAIMACVSDGANTSVLTTGVGMAADTPFLVEGWWDGTNWNACVNGSTPVQLSSNLPADGTELGWTASLITTTASAKAYQFSRFWLDFN